MADLLKLHLLQPHQWKQAEESHLLLDKVISELAQLNCPAGGTCRSLLHILTESLPAKISFIVVVALICWRLSRHLRTSQHYLLLALVGAAMGLSDLLANQTKYLFQRLRPDLGLWFLEGPYQPSYSMPSNHAFNLAALAALIFVLTRAKFFQGVKFPMLLVIVAFCVGVSRVFMHRHYPLDVVAGFAFGGLFGALAAVLAQRILGRPTAQA